jgi:hypothetical protein
MAAVWTAAQQRGLLNASHVWGLGPDNYDEWRKIPRNGGFFLNV